MANYAPNVTPRYKVKYTVVGRVHTAQIRSFRGNGAVPVAEAGRTFFDNLFGTLAAGLADDFAYISAEVALTDSDVFFPALLPAAVTGLIDVTTYTKQDSITHLTLSGRGTGTGAKISLKVYGINFNPDTIPANIASDFVLNPGENSLVDSAIAAIQASPNVRAIDNSTILWSGRATLKVNDRWLRQVRKGL